MLVNDLAAAAKFYKVMWGCTRGPKSVEWIDLHFFEQQVVLGRADWPCVGGLRIGERYDGNLCSVGLRQSHVSSNSLAR